MFELPGRVVKFITEVAQVPRPVDEVLRGSMPRRAEGGQAEGKLNGECHRDHVVLDPLVLWPGVRASQSDRARLICRPLLAFDDLSGRPADVVSIIVGLQNGDPSVRTRLVEPVRSSADDPVTKQYV